MKMTKIVITVGTAFRKSGDLVGVSGLNRMYRNATQYMLEQCGAYQINTIQGGWREGGKDWVEPALVFSVCVDTEKMSVTPKQIAEHLRDIFDQKCVSLEAYYVAFRLI